MSHDDVVAEKTVVRDVGLRHDQAVVANLSQHAATGSSAVDSNEFTNLVLVCR